MAATLTQLNVAMAEPTMIEKTRSSLIKAAKNVAFEATDTANHANRLKWSKAVLKDPVGNAANMWRFVVGVLSDRDLGEVGTPGTTILGASDQDIDDNVSLGINIFADGT